MKFTYYGHACFSVVIAGKTILFDPFITGNELAAAINIDEIPADYIFVTHCHFDHSLDVISIATKTGATVIGCWELCDHFGKQGVVKTQPLNPGGKFKFEFGVVKAVVAHIPAVSAMVAMRAPPAALSLNLRKGIFITAATRL